MSLTARNLRLFADAGGNFSSVRPIASPDVVWAAISDYDNQPVDVAFSVDMRLKLSGAGAATAVISLIGISGDSPATLGLTIENGDDLETLAATEGSGVLQLQADYGGNAYLSEQFAFSVTSDAVDSVAPTIPFIVSATVIDDDRIDLEIMPGMDPVTAASSASGMASVIIDRNEDGGAYSPLVTKVTANGISPLFVEHTIGVHGTAPSSIQTASDWRMVAEGVDGLKEAADEIYARLAPITGDFNLSCKIPEFTGVTGGKAMGGIIVRQSIAPGAKMIALGRLHNDYLGGGTVPKYSEVKWRTGLDINLNYDNPQDDLSGEYWFWIQRVGDVFTCYLYKAGWSDWVSIGQQTIVMSGAVEAGPFCNSGKAGALVTLDIENVALQNLAIITHSDTGLDPETQYGYKPYSTDNA